jgi:hypothetical protein
MSFSFVASAITREAGSMRNAMKRATSLAKMVGACLLIPLLGSLAMLDDQAAAADLQISPQMRLNTAIPDPIFRADVNADESIVVTSSAYKAVTEWQLRDFKTTVRHFPLRLEQLKFPHGVALSPNGHFLAYAVPPLLDANKQPREGTGRIYLIDRVNNKGLPPLASPARAYAMRFSPDGAYLAAVFADGYGLRVWSTDSWVEVFADEERQYVTGAEPAPKKICPADASTSHVAFDTSHLAFNRTSSAGVWLVTSGESGVRLYERSGTSIVRKRQVAPADIGLCSPGGVDINADGLLAVGDWLGLQVAVVGLESMQPVQMLDVETIRARPRRADESFFTVAWHETNGKQLLFAGGIAWCAFFKADVQPKDVGSRSNCMLRWEWKGDRAPWPLDAGDDTVQELLSLRKSGNLIVVAANGLKVMTAGGETTALSSGQAAAAWIEAFDFRNLRDDELDKGGIEKDVQIFKISADAKSVLFNQYNDPEDRALLRFDLSKLRLETPTRPESLTGLVEPNQDPAVVKRWFSPSWGVLPIVRGTEVQLREDFDPNDQSRSVAVHRDQSGPKYVLWGSSRFLRLLDMNGKVVCKEPVQQEAFRVNITPDGRKAVVAHRDGVLRWYKIDRPGEGCRFRLLLSLYVHGSSKTNWRAVAWEPGGKFAVINDLNASKLLGWLEFNESNARLLELERYFKKNWNEKAVKRALDVTVPVDPVVGQRDARTRYDLRIDSRKQEIIDDLKQAVKFRITDTLAESFASPTGMSLAQLAVLVNDNAVAFSSGGVAYDRGDPYPITRVGVHEIEVQIPKIELSVKNDGRITICLELDPDGIYKKECVWRTWRKREDLWHPPRRLSAVIVGMSRYDANARSLLNLRYAHNDALDLTQLLVNDYARVRARQPQANAIVDFDELDITLFVAPVGTAAQAQLEQFERYAQESHGPKLKVVRSGFSSKAIRDRIAEIARERNAEREPEKEELFFFSFAGHGLTLAGDANPESHFLLPGYRPGTGLANVRANSIASDDLGRSLGEITSPKVIVLDACQNSIRAIGGVPMEGTPAVADIANRVKRALIFVSAGTAVASFEQDSLVFEDAYRSYTGSRLTNPPRPRAQSGNGLFSVAFMTSLVDPRSLKGSSVPDGRVRADDAKRYLKYYFDPRQHDKMEEFLQNLDRLLPVPSAFFQGNDELVLRTLAPAN